jgi:MoaA/NifB/PqqE/SkfB family radical SAM enzyme
MRIREWAKLWSVFSKTDGKLPAHHLLYIAKELQNENPHEHDGKVYINTHFPPFPSKAFDEFLEAVVQRKRVPHSAYFAVTDKCPFKCKHCSYGMHKRGTMSTEQAKGVIEQLRSVGTVTLGFTGGEPLLREDIVELVKAATDIDMATIVFSTAYNLTKELAAKFKEAKLGCLMVGMESDKADEHDEVRGVKGSFAKALEAIKISLDAGLYTGISTVGTRGKIVGGQIERMAELGTQLGVMEFRILEPVPTGSLRGDENEILTEEESQWLLNFHKSWNRKQTGPAIACFSYLESSQMFGCGAGYHHVYVDAVGNVCPCDLTPLSFGNLLEEPLTKIWARLGEHFGQPRQACFMKELCKRTGGLGDGELPLKLEASVEFCNKCAHDGNLPKIYRNILQG